MKKLAILLAVLSVPAYALACIDCTGVGSDITIAGETKSSTFTAGYVILGNSTGVPNAAAISESTTSLNLLLAAAAAGKRNYSGIVVGTAGAVGVDAYVTNVNQFNLILGSFAARGLTTSTTVQGKIYFREGTYDMTGTTVPRGIKLYAIGSSVTFILNATDKELIYNYGEIGTSQHPFTLSGNGLAFRGYGTISIKSNSKTYAIITGGQGIPNGVSNVNFILVEDSTNAVGAIDFQQTRSVTNGNLIGLVNNFLMRNSSFCVFDLKVASFSQAAVSGVGVNGYFYFVNGFFNKVKFDADMSCIGFIGISGSAGAGNQFLGKIRNAPNQTALPGVGWGIISSDLNLGAVSSGTIFNIDFLLEGNGANVICMYLQHVIKNASVIGGSFRGTVAGNTYIGIVAQTGIFKANIQNVTMTNIGTGVSDLGNGTIFRYTRDNVLFSQ